MVYDLDELLTGLKAIYQKNYWSKRTMTDGFSIVDIIFLLLALFIGYKMYTMMGVKTGIEKKSNFKNGFGFGKGTKESKSIENAPLITGLKKIGIADRAFNPQHFLEKAQASFESIVKAFVSGNQDQLKGLVSGDVFEVLVHEITKRKTAEHTVDLNFFRLVSAEILESNLENHIANVTVQFVSEQVLLTHDAQGKLIEGDPDAIDKVTDTWTFERDTRTKSSKWILIEMRNLEE